MIRALTALLGFAAAAALIAIAPDAADLGDSSARDVWLIAGTWALAGLVAGILYQAGGVRRPGLRFNPWLFLLVFTPWALLTVGLVSLRANPDSAIADLTRDLVPDGILDNWLTALAAFAFVSGLLLAFSMVEPLVGTTPEAVMRRETVVAEPVGSTTVVDDDVDVRERTAIVDAPRDLDERDRRLIRDDVGDRPADDDVVTQEPAPTRLADGERTVVRASDEPTVIRTSDRR